MIDKEEFEKCSVKGNLDFIKKVLSLVTHNAFTKDDLLFLIKWQNAIIEKMKCCGNCKNLKYHEQALSLYECNTYDVGDVRGACDNWELAE
jgi:hypothetical protein